jgi:hypothetical protein
MLINFAVYIEHLSLTVFKIKAENSQIGHFRSNIPYKGSLYNFDLWRLFCRASLTEHFSKQKFFSIYNSFQNIRQQVQRLRPNGDFFLELLILKKEGRLYFPLSAIVFEILISQKLQFDPYVDLCSILAVTAIFFGRR